MDGAGTAKVLECFAAQTRGEELDASSIWKKGETSILNLYVDMDLLRYTADNEDDKCTAIDEREFPEYQFDPHCRGPTQPIIPNDGGTSTSDIPKTGKIFIFTTAALKEMKAGSFAELKKLNPDASPQSTYALLAALAWTRIAIARVQTENFLLPHERSDRAKMSNPVNWKLRVSSSAACGYSGNGVAKAVTVLHPDFLLSVHRGGCFKQLALIAREINSTILRVDSDFVISRKNLYRRLVEPRQLGLRWDYRQPTHLNFNSWRHMGAEAKWSLPGVSVTYPDAIRKLPGEWGIGDVLILLGRADSGRYELLISPPEVSMKALCEDDCWMTWVDRVVG